MKVIFSIITSNVENAVLGAGDLIGSGAKAVGGAVANGASSVIKGVGGLFSSDKNTNETESVDGK